MTESMFCDALRKFMDELMAIDAECSKIVVSQNTFNILSQYRMSSGESRYPIDMHVIPAWIDYYHPSGKVTIAPEQKETK